MLVFTEEQHSVGVFNALKSIKSNVKRLLDYTDYYSLQPCQCTTTLHATLTNML